MATDVVEFRRGERTYRVVGLEQRGAEVAGAVGRLDEVISARIAAARAALAEWRGPHAHRFAQEANAVLGELGGLRAMMATARDRLWAFPDAPAGSGDGGAGGWISPPPERAGLVSAAPDQLLAYAHEASSHDMALPALASTVTLEGVSCEVTVESPLPVAEQDVLLAQGMSAGQVAEQRHLDTHRLGSGELAELIALPDCYPQAQQAQGRSAACNEFVAEVAGRLQQVDAQTPGWATELFGGLVRAPAAWLDRGGPVPVGFESAAHARAEAQRLFDELQEMLEHGALDGALTDPERLDHWFEELATGQYDWRFAVAFTELIGFEGYLVATALLRERYPGQVPAEGIEHLQVLANTLSTAMDTMPRGSRDSYLNPDHATLTDNQRLDPTIVDLLVSGDLPRPAGAWPQATALDLSVLLGLTRPPTQVSVDIANAYLTPALHEPPSLPGDDNPWGERGDPVTNHATMLSRDPGASALWLWDQPEDHRHNLEVVLEHLAETAGAYHHDGGQALAAVVEHGLTHPDLRLPLPGTPHVAGKPLEGPLLREKLLDVAIDTLNDLGEIRSLDRDQAAGVTAEHVNPVYDALASGIQANLTYIDRRINRRWGALADTALSADKTAPREAVELHDFLSVVMVDDAAAGRIWAGLAGYSLAQSTTAFSQGGQRQDQLLVRAAAMQGIFSAAEGKTGVDEFDRQQRKARQFDRYIDGLSLIPVVAGARALPEGIRALSQVPETVSSLDSAGTIFSGKSPGEFFYPTPAATAAEQRLQEAEATIDHKKNFQRLVALGKELANLEVSPAQLTEADRQEIMDRIYGPLPEFPEIGDVFENARRLVTEASEPRK